MRKPAAVKTTSAAPAQLPATAAAQPAAKAAAKPAVKPESTPAAGKAATAKPAPAAARAKPAVKAAPAKAAAPKSARQAAAKRPASPATPATGEPVREKGRKARLVRDSFTMPEHEYELLGQVKKACLKAGFEIKKSELLRIGVALIGQLDLATLQNVLASLPQLKTGRPKKI
ncbi:hypothetical protein [Massilia psychrophila]|jgi:hypothetical protein|uniref:hypothetical protein n=1 Tax=Massilia psychrophila TaxID=1603353 RepID=UPI0015D47444|nr:hypothetical protein [Massilia psychrophila]GGE68457.1 hypothetical protein GCM10008020_11170 [Massilia psychrophila]